MPGAIEGNHVILPLSMRKKAMEVGRARYEENRALNRGGRYGGPGNDLAGLKLDLLGAAGEAAYAWWDGRDWDGNLGNLDAADVDHLQVRTTDHPNGRLILHPPPTLRPDGKLSRGDKPNDIFIHVRALGCGHFELVGWLIAQDGQLKKYWWDPGNDRPAYFVDNGILNSMLTLRAEALYRRI